VYLIIRASMHLQILFAYLIFHVVFVVINGQPASSNQTGELVASCECSNLILSM